MNDIKQIPSPHFGERKKGVKPVFLIMHYTVLGAPETTHVFTGKSTNPEGNRVSAHYMIDEQGGITQFVDEKARAWHAGVSCWDGNTDINSASIGIELVNPGHERGYRAFPALQMAALIALSRDIIGRHKISAHHVLGHSDIAPDRKKDPGELFDWKMLAAKGVGLWPAPTEDHFKRAARRLHDGGGIREKLGQYGYDGSKPLDVLLSAFQRHFVPERYGTPDEVGQPDRTTLARLLALLDQKS